MKIVVLTCVVHGYESRIFFSFRETCTSWLTFIPIYFANDAAVFLF